VKTQVEEQTASMQYKVAELARAARQAYQSKRWQVTKVNGC
jgi:hypothetical protein